MVKFEWTLNQGSCGGCCKGSKNKPPASVPEWPPFLTPSPALGLASPIHLDFSAVREPRTTGGQKLSIARLLGTQLASTYQWWITCHHSHALTSQPTNKDLLSTFFGTSHMPGDWLEGSNQIAMWRLLGSELLCLLFLWEPKFSLVKW